MTMTREEIMTTADPSVRPFVRPSVRPSPRLLALCAGYGGLEAAVLAGLGGKVVAFAENNPAAAAVYTYRHPGILNLGDITEVGWETIRDLYAPDVIVAGFPCRNISNAGDRTGIGGEWSRVWKDVAKAVGIVRPRLVFLENVGAILRRGLGTVAGDLAAHGYDIRWTCLRASDPAIGAPHHRDRWFGLAYPTAQDPDRSAWNERRPAASGQTQGGGHGPTLEDEAVFLLANAHIGGRNGRTGNQSEQGGRDEPAYGCDAASRAAGDVRTLPTPAARDWKSGASNLIGTNSRPLNEVVVNTIPDAGWISTDGKDYGPAVRRWEAAIQRSAPCPTEPGTKCNRRLSPVFEEWMMGLPDGWVTGVPGISRKDQMVMLGNGAMWQQAHEAYSRLFVMDTSVPEQPEA